MTTKTTGQHTQGKLEQRNSTRVYSAGRHVADCGSRNPEGLPRHIGLEDAANAAFIVRACNNHDALVKALQSLFKHCAMVHKCWGDSDNTKEADAAIKAGEAAIASATKE